MSVFAFMVRKIKLLLMNDSRYQQAKRVTLIGAFGNVVLSILKIFFGIFGHSQALFADGIHSVSDVLTDILVLFAARAGNQAPDHKHPYGHGRVETVFTVVLSIILLLVSAGLIYDAIVESFLFPTIVKPGIWTLVVAFVSMIVNEGMFHFTFRIGQRINSNLLNANAWHHRSDAFSSLIVLVGIIGTMFGVHYFDGIAAILVALMILKMGITMGWASLQEMMDASVEASLLEQFNAVIQAVPGVKSVHQLRTRLLGGAIFVDVHVQVDPRISVSEGHYIGEQVQKNLGLKFSRVADVTVHVDSEDDERVMLSILLPDRQAIHEALKACWCDLPGCRDIQQMSLHYLNGKIEVELLLPVELLKTVDQGEKLQSQYQQQAQKINYIDKVTIYFS